MMRLLEYESKCLLREVGIETPPGRLATSPQDAETAVQDLEGAAVIKSQVPIGGRGKAGGVVFVSEPAEALAAAERLLSVPLRGYEVERLLVEKQEQPQQEFYLAITYDPARRSPVVLASAAGGIEVEGMAGSVLRRPVSLRRPWPTFRSRELAAALGLSGRPLRGMTGTIDRLIAAFLQLDALLVEINPLLLTTDGRLIAVDAHIELDDEALFRHQDLVERFGLAGRGERPLLDFERRALEIDRADHRGVAGRMVQFDGDLGLLIGGGGASLTAFDAVLDAGLRPANYCEIGGNPSVWKVKELTKLILSQPRVERIAVIMNVVSNTRVDLVARGVIKGILELGRDPATTIAAFRVPGSWEEEGFALLTHYGVPFFSRETSIDQVVAVIAQGKG
jgi:succinyl-CoA synthetase beta subunit/citryl-CoA synthetase large subunit